MTDRQTETGATVAGVTAEDLAVARQTLAHNGTGYVPPWSELSEREREVSILEAGSWLTALRNTLDATAAPGSSRPRQDVHAQGYAEAVARLRDDDRYRNWWTALPPQDPAYGYWQGPARRHLSDYLETVGPDGPDMSAGIPVLSRATIAAVQAEAARAHLKHGPKTLINPDMPVLEKLAALVEECGEVGRALTYDQDHAEPLVKELIQVASVALSWVEAIDRRQT